MGIRINTNFTALNAYRHIGVAEGRLAKSVERLSSGLRINHAQDDPSGLAIADKIRSQVEGLERASMNAQDGVSLLQTAEGALGEIGNMLHRIRELAIQAANGTLTANDRVEIQKEVDQLLDEVDRTAVATEFNTKSLLNGDLSALVSVDDAALTPIITGETPVDGNYRLETQVTPGQAQVLKSDIFRIVAGEQYKLGTRGAAEDRAALADTMVFERAGDIVVRNSSGTEWTIGAGTRAKLSHDGDMLAFVNANEVFTYDLTRLGDADDPGAVQITSAVANVTDVSFSYDDTQVLFLDANQNLWVSPTNPVSPQAGTRIDTVANMTGAAALAAGNITAAHWSGTDNRILFEWNDGATESGVGYVNADGTGVTVVATGANAGASSVVSNASWSPDGGRILYDNGNWGVGTDASDIYVYDTETATAAQLTSSTATSAAGLAVFSSDGSKIAYVQDTDAGAGYAYQVWIMNADGTDKHATTSLAYTTLGGGAPANLSWSTDGDWLYFAAADAVGNTTGANGDIWRVRADGSAAAQNLTSDGAANVEDVLHVGRSGFWVSEENQPTAADFTLWQDIDWSGSPDNDRYPGSPNLKQDFSIQYQFGAQDITGLDAAVSASGNGANWIAAPTQFLIQALDANGNEIGRSSVVTRVLANATDEVDLSWDAVAGAATYRVWQDNGDASFTDADQTYIDVTTTSFTWADANAGSGANAGALAATPTYHSDRFGVVDYDTTSRWEGFTLTPASGAALTADAYTQTAPYVLLEVVGVRVTDSTAVYTVSGDQMTIDSTLLDGGVATQRIQLRATTYTRDGEVRQTKTFEMDASQWTTSNDILDSATFADLDGAYANTTIRMGANGNKVVVGDKVMLLYDAAAQYGGGAVWTTQNLDDAGSFMLDTSGQTVRSGTQSNRVGARVAAASASAYLSGIEIAQSVAWIDGDGNVHVGTGRVRYGEQPTQQVDFNLMETDLAERVTELQWVDRFQSSSSLFDLTSQTITIYGNGEQSDVVLQARDTLEEVAAKFRQAIVGSLAEGALGMSVDNDLTSDGVDGNTAVFITQGSTNTDEAVEGTIVLRSTIPSLDGRFFFSGDEDILNAFSWAEVKAADLNSMDVTVYDAHSGQRLDRQVVNDGVLRSSIPGVDVAINQKKDVQVKWDGVLKSFSFSSDFGIDVSHVHVAANPLALMVGANPGQTIEAIVGEVTRESLELGKLLLVDRDVAEEGVVRIDAAIDKVNSQRARIGAYMSRLDTTMNILDITAENLTAAESRIRDLDMAQQTTDFTRDQILVQAATAMLAQANALPQSVLSLLQ